MKFEQSETLQCLINAFAGESQARNRYTFYAKAAEKEGFEYISQVFLETAENERQHAKLFYKHIPASEHWQVNASYPFFLGETKDNLIAAANGEKEEWEILYKHSSLVAKEEGYDEISNLFAGILEIEKHHSHRFKMLAEELKNGTFFSKPEQTQWHCRKCGYIQISKCAPLACPVCKHEQGYFELFVEKY